MLRVFVYLGGGPEHIEVKTARAGQSLLALTNEGRKAHFWWTAEDVEQDPAAQVLRSLVPHVDRLWVGRDFGSAHGMQPVFDGVVVECGYDPSMVNLIGLELPRRNAAPPPPAAGVREPLRPVPSGPGPEASPTPQTMGGADLFARVSPAEATPPMSLRPV